MFLFVSISRAGAGRGSDIHPATAAFIDGDVQVHEHGPYMRRGQGREGPKTRSSVRLELRGDPPGC